MKIKQTIRNLVLGGFFIIPFVAAMMSTPVLAAEDCETGPCCGGIPTSIISCDQPGTTEDETKTTEQTVKDSGLWGLLLLVINILTAGVGVLALGGIVYGAVLYTSAGGNPEQVKKARTIFTNVVIGVVAFGGMYALLNFLVPGGVFN